MNHIYCLLVGGGSLTDEIRTSLLIAAHEMMERRERKMRLVVKTHGVKGYLLTGYQLSMLGTVSGFIFKGEFCHEGRDIKTEFIVRPIKDLDRLANGTWVRAPLFPLPIPDSTWN